MTNRVRIEIEFEQPGSHTIQECCDLVMNQMRAMPVWEQEAGTGLLNYVQYDRTMHVRSAQLVDAKSTQGRE